MSVRSRLGSVFVTLLVTSPFVAPFVSPFLCPAGAAAQSKAPPATTTPGAVKPTDGTPPKATPPKATSAQDATAPAGDLDAQIAAARKLTAPPRPDATANARSVGQVGDRTITLGELLDEAMLLYGVPVVDVLARNHVMLLEAARRGITIEPKDVRAAVARFIARRAKKRSLREVLATAHMDWPRFEARMRVDAAMHAMLKADGVDRTDDNAGERWVQTTLARYTIETDPAKLPPVLFARIFAADDTERKNALASVDRDDLLAERLPGLKLRHLDRAFAQRAKHEAFLIEARKRNLQASEARVTARVQAARAGFSGGMTWERALKMIGRNLHLELRAFRRDDIIDQVIGTNVDDATLLTYYKTRPDHFGRATVTASHILIREADPQTGRVDYHASKRKIDEVHAHLRNGVRFIDLVQRYSQDPVSRKRGGDVGMFTLESSYDPAFCRLAFNLREGEASPPVRTTQGWHIIYCRHRTKPDLEAYAFDKVRDIVRQDRQADLRARWLRENVEDGLVMKPAIDAVATPYLAMPTDEKPAAPK